MAELVELLGNFFAELDLTEMPEQEFGADLFDFMVRLRDLLKQGGEAPYHCRQAALHVVSGLQRVLRRDLDPREVPQEQAQLLDAAFSKIQGVRTGVAGAQPKLDRLEKLENDSKKFFEEAAKDSRLTVKVPVG